MTNQPLRGVTRFTGTLLLSVLLAGCGSDSPTANNSNPPSLTVLSLPPQSDTIEAEPSEPYVLAVANGDGTPVVGTTVSFTGSNASVAAPGGVFRGTTSLQTDSRGEIAVSIRYGLDAGPGSVIASVPTIQRADTLELEVEPGMAVGPGIFPGDTVVVVDLPFPFTATPVDRLGNVAGPALTPTVHGPLALDGSEATGTSIGEARLSAVLDGVTASTEILIVPDGQLVYASGSDAWLTRFDGREAVELGMEVPPAREPSMSWDTDGRRIVTGGYDGFVVFDLETGVVSPSAWPAGTVGSTVLWPRFGPDGRVYYTTDDGLGGWHLRHASIDAQDAEWVIPVDRFPNDDFHLDWSPDGGAFVFTADWEEPSRYLLRVSDAEANMITSLSVEGVTPVWSPDGSLIAYQELGLVGVVSPDESISRSWDLGWGKGVTWSPDSRMLVGVLDGYVTVLDVETGVSVRLIHLPGSIDAVAWRPE